MFALFLGMRRLGAIFAKTKMKITSCVDRARKLLKNDKTPILIFLIVVIFYLLLAVYLTNNARNFNGNYWLNFKRGVTDNAC